MDADNSQNEKIYADYRRDLLSRQLSNSEKYDAAILTLSMAALGVSMTFISSIVHLEIALCRWLLILSWSLFTLSIISVIISFQVSNKGIETNIGYAEKYYLNNDSSYFDRENKWSNATTKINMISGATFIFAIVCTILFITINLNNIQEVNMSENSKVEFGVEKRIESIGLGGAEIPRMQVKPSETRGQEIPAMQPAKEPITQTTKPQTK